MKMAVDKRRTRQLAIALYFTQCRLLQLCANRGYLPIDDAYIYAFVTVD